MYLALVRAPSLATLFTTTGRFRGFTSSIWLDDESTKFRETFDRIWTDDADRDDTTAAAASPTSIGGERIRVVPTNGPTEHGAIHPIW